MAIEQHGCQDLIKSEALSSVVTESRLWYFCCGVYVIPFTGQIVIDKPVCDMATYTPSFIHHIYGG
ncbi:MAG: hypothetical protein JW902_02050 [Syntrophaceae bacterium]|nr:hypothetical protein [Syntrophaceae bacterium]